MIFRNYTPKYPLGEFIDIIWYWEGKNLLKGKECALPSGTMELVINLDSPKTSDSIVSGARSTHFVIGDTNQERLLGIHFRPGGAFPFLPFPFGELHNQSINLSDLWGESRASQLLSLLHEAETVGTLHDVETVTAKFEVLEKWLLASLVHPPQHHPAVAYSMKQISAHSGLSTADLDEKVNYSQRRFIQIFRNEVGLPPKLFSRVLRFQGVLDEVETQTEVNWLDIALRFDYYDQAHFIHDFREFSGHTPAKYLTLRTEHRNHISSPS